MRQRYALDFDGVICDSAVETGLTGWKVARQLWTDMPEQLPPALLDDFRKVRPVMETGYEAALMMRCLYEGITPDKLLHHFDSLIRHLVRRDEINLERLKQRFGQTRDDWIAHNEAEWLARNPLFEGVPETLRQWDESQIYIITTKQERFVKKILRAHNVPFNHDHIFGLDRGLGKDQILTELRQRHSADPLLFVEDRLPTLLNIMAVPQLSTVTLYLADWGYNTEKDREIAQHTDRISILDLRQLSQL